MRKQCYLLRLVLLTTLVMLITSAYSQTCPTGLVSYWKMDELSGKTLYDYKSSYHASSNNELAIDEIGIAGTSRYFNTTETYVGDKAVVLDNSNFGFPVDGSFTILYWVKCSEVVYNAQDHCIISKGDWKGGSPITAYWSSGINGSGKFNFILQDSNGHREELETPTGDYNDGTWHQIALIRDNSNDNIYLYVDGVAEVTHNYNYTGSFINSNDIQFANLLSSGVYQYFFKGSMDEVAIYNRALSSTEVVNQFNTARTNGMGICDGSNPVISSIPKTKAIVGVNYTYAVRARGVQTGITYSLVTFPSGMLINQSTGLIQWTPTSITQDGLVRVRAYNSSYPPADTQTFRINLALGTPCPDNLLLLLKLDETNGPTYADHYGAHNGTAVASPAAINGKIDGGQNFDASTKINIPDNGTEFEWNAASNFSFECWMKPSNVATPGMVVLGRINIFEGGEYAHWNFGTNPGGYANFELWDNWGNGGIITGSKILTDGAWHHVVAVRNGSSNMNKLYVDGELQASQSFAYSVTFNSDVQPNDVNLGYIRRASPSAEEYHFKGGLDEVAVFNRALSDADVTTFYNLNNPVGHCSDGNYAPVITSTPVTSAAEDVPYSYTFTADDIDVSDVLTLSAVTKPSWLIFTWTAGQKTATLSGTPNSSQVGDHNVTLRVYDQKVQIDQSFVINVANVNSEPVVTSTPVTTANEDAAYTYTITVTDADAGDNIDMTAVTKPSWLTLTHVSGAKTATLTGTPVFANIGANSIDISITDHHQTIHHTFVITVSAVNDAPVISAQSALSTNEDVVITLQKANFTITDEDNSLSEVTLTVQAGTNYTFVGNTVTPAANYNGELSVNVIASDPYVNSQVFHAIITVNAVNDPPQVTSDPTLTGYVGNLYSYLFTASDVDDATLTKSVVQKPDWLSFTATNGVLAGTPASANKGQHLVILRVSDGKIDVDQDFVITVSGPDGLESLEAAGILVYPVPARDFLEIQFEKLMEATHAEVISSVGQVVRKAVIPAETDHFRIGLEGIETGTYFLRLNNSTMNNLGRIVIIK